jgi:hypothetical protein
LSALFCCYLQVEREGKETSQDLSLPNLPQPYCNPLGYAAPISLPSPSTAM